MLTLLAHGAEFGSPPEVVLSGASWRAMQAPDPVPIVAPGPRVVSRDLELRKHSEGVDLVVRWRLDADEAGWFDAPLIGADVLVTSLSWSGRPVGLSPLDGPMRAVTLWVDGPGELVLRGVREARVAPGEGPLIRMLAAPRGTARAPADWVFASDGMAPVGGGRWWGGTTEVAVVGRRAVASARGALLGATVAMGITVDEGAMQVAARLHVTALRGGIDGVVFSVPGAGPDLSVEGPQVASFERQGDRVTVALRQADAPSAWLDVRWSASTPGGATASVAAPSLVPEGVVRTAYVTKLARAGDREVVPEGDGWRAVALAELPDWADGLLSGTATGALSTSGTGRGPARLQLQLLRFEPVAGPKTLIDTAQTAVALSDEGRMLMRTHLQVRNDRGATLRVTPPPGARIVGVSVAGELPEPLVDGRSWRLPLKKSVETVEGLLSFPVRIVMVGDAPAFDGRTRDRLALPIFDADIAVHRVSVNLPMGHASRLKHDEQHVVASFTEGSGITYGFAVGDARATEADVLFQSAVSQWMSNDFDAAQSSLDQLRGFGAGSEDMDRLQSNLDLLFAEDQEKESATSRRVKEQAKYRSIEESREQSRLLDEAEQALLEGDYDVAESNYAKALDIGGKLAKLDAGEDKSNAFKNAVVERKLASTSTLSKQKKKAVDDATRGAREAEERQRQEQARQQVQADATRQAEAESARRWAEEDRRRAAVEASERVHREAAAAAHAAAEQARHAAETSGIAAAYTATVDEPSPLVQGTNQRIIIPDSEAPSDVLEFAAQTVHDVSDTSRSTVLTKDLLNRVPSGRSYQSSVQRTAGASGGSNPNMGGAASHENAHVLDGQNVGEGVMGGVPGGVVGGVVGDVLGGGLGGVAEGQSAPGSPRSASGEVDGVANDGWSDDEEIEEAEALEIHEVDSTSLPMPSGRTSVRLLKLSEKGGRKRKESRQAYTEIDFEGVDIEGELIKPQGAILLDRNKAGLGGREERERADRATTYPPAETIEIAMGGEDEPPDVKATSLDVIVPEQGETVRYQHLLVPAGDALTVPIHTRPQRSRRNR